MDYNEMIGRSRSLFDQVRVILENKDASAEDKAKIEPLLTEAKGLKADAARLNEITEAVKGMPSLVAAGATQQPARSSFKNFGQFLCAVADAGNTRNRGPLHPALAAFSDPNEPGNAKQHGTGTQWQEKVTMNEAIGAQGGFLVPVEQLNELYGVAPQANTVRARATVIPMRRRQISIPVLDQTGTTAGQPHWFGGILARWTEESGTKAQYDATFKQIPLVAHKLVCYTRASDELLDDEGVGLVSFLTGPMGFVGAINWEEEFCFLQGTGAGQPLGVIGAPATIVIPAQQNPPAPATIYTDLVNMLEAFLPGANGVWFINQQHLSDLMLANGPAGNASYLWGSMGGGPLPNILGYPYVLTEKLPLPGTQGSILLADFKYYLVGDRKATTIDSTNIERFQYDETSWRAVHRVDGQPWLSLPLTLQDGSTQVSPFVVLGSKTT